MNLFISKYLLKPICLFTVLTVLGGCTYVVAKHPVGKQVTSSKTFSDMSMTGIWMLQTGPNEHGSLAKLPNIIFVKRNKHQLQVASVKWANGKFELQESKMLLTQAGKDVYYLNLPYQSSMLGSNTKKKHNNEGYLFARVLARSGDMLILLRPERTYFKTMVKAGTIKGDFTKNIIQNDDLIYLDMSRSELADLLQPSKISVQFDITRPIVYKKLTSNLDEQD